mgnify:CR=1 FL=1
MERGLLLMRTVFFRFCSHFCFEQTLLPQAYRAVKEVQQQRDGGAFRAREPLYDTAHKRGYRQFLGGFHGKRCKRSHV